jgi:hypothetical protein
MNIATTQTTLTVTFGFSSARLTDSAHEPAADRSPC